MKARTILLLAAAMVAALAGSPAASAQSQSNLVLQLEAPPAPITQPSTPLVIQGITTFTGDLLQYQHTQGIPITYAVTKLPPWATVLVTPETDVMPLPSAPSGLTIYAARPFTVTVVLDPEFAQQPGFPRQIVELIEITVTQGPTTLGVPAQGKGTVPITVVLPDDEEPCALDHEALLVDAVDAYNAHQAMLAAPEDEPEEVTVQGASVSPVTTSAIALGAFALVGAGVGLVLRRRLR